MEEYQKIKENLVQEFRRGILVYVVLLNCNESIYGYSLVGKLEKSGIPIEKNTLYPLLRRLEKQGLLSSNWNTKESRPRKYYILTELGIKILNELRIEWADLNNKLNQIIKGESK